MGQHDSRAGADRQFDFWIGDWEVTWGEDDRGVNRIRAVLSDHVILENFDGAPSIPFQGMSVSVYNHILNRWQQTWVDNQGGYLDFCGEFKDDRMILEREAIADGAPIRQRMVWYHIERDSLDWNWERSDDQGQTWKVIWKIHYRRIA